MGMFDNYKNITNKEIPNNLHLFCDKDQTDTIVIGGTTTHVFTLFFDYRTVCREADWFEITYKQSISDPIVQYDIQSSNVTFSVEDGKTILKVFIDADTSKLFDPFRSTFAQLKLYTNDENIVYGDLNKIIVIDTLDRGA